MNVPNRTAARIAYAAAAINLLASVVMLFVLRPGLPARGDFVALRSRHAYVSTHLAAWRIGWLLWNAAAVVLLAFFVVLSLRWRDRAPVVSRLALVVAGAGLAADLIAEAVLMSLAQRFPAGGYVGAEAFAILLTGYVGNGLYTVAGILLTWAGRRDLPALLLYVAVPVWVAGLWLAAATLGGSTTGQVLSTSVLMPMFVLWAFLVGRWLSASES